MRRWGPFAALAAATIAAGAAPSAASAAHLVLGGGTQFPARTLVLSGVPRGALTPANIHITENGQSVAGDSVEPLSADRRGELGVVLVIDRSPSMAGSPSQAALTAARTLAAERLPHQQLGIVSFDSTAAVSLPLTTNGAAINQALQQLPPIGPGTHILPALSLAVHELYAAKVTAGAVILLSDGADREPMNTLTPQSVAALARAAHVQIFTVGLRDRYYTPSSMRQLAQVGGGQFIEALTGSAVKQIFSRIQSSLVASWLIRYGSTQPLGQQVTVSVRVDGVPGVLTLTYASPPAPSVVHSAVVPTHHPPFWQSTLALYIVVGVCVLLLFIPLWLALRRRSGPPPVTARVRGFVATPSEAAGGSPSTSITDAAAERTRATFSKRSWWPDFVEALDIAMFDVSPERVIMWTGVGALLLAALLCLASGSIIFGLVPLIAAPFGLRSFLRGRVTKQRNKFSDLIPSHIEEVSASIRAGRSLIEALNVVNEGAEEPVHREFDRALTDENLGRPIDDTLRVLSSRMTSESVDQVAVVASMHRRTGSSITEALDRVAEGARDRADLKRELSALTAQGRLARWILTFLPPVILLIMWLVSPHYVWPLFHTTPGVIALIIASIMVVMGSLVMKRIVEIEV